MSSPAKPKSRDASLSPVSAIRPPPSLYYNPPPPDYHHHRIGYDPAVLDLLATTAQNEPRGGALDYPRLADLPPPQDYPHLADRPLNQDGYDEKERDAIRNLLDVPDVDIPVWDRQREPIALRHKLMAHQHVGLTWLINQEKSPHKGGILADDMGLGKTIQALALILCRPPQDGTRKTTLIVVPTSLLRQWEREIDDKVKPGHKLKTVIFHGMKKRNMTVAKLLSHDVVLTTYGTLAHEWKQLYEKRTPGCAVLLASHAIFHRVILDEAHNIKNRNSQSSQAVDRLRATYRLCMTGTPLMNRLDELYPLMRFLHIEPYHVWEKFRQNLTAYKGGEARAMKQLHVLLGRILLRRTEKTMVDGQPILTLPELTVETVKAEFDTDQLDYYKSLEQRSRLRMNRFLKEGTVTRHYWYILLLILRLRQCCCHPYLLKDHAIPEGVNMTLEEMTQLTHKLTPRIIGEIRNRKNFTCPNCHEDTEHPIIIYPCGHLICGDCITNMLSEGHGEMKYAPDDDDEEHALVGACPTEGCDGIVDSKRVICYNSFVEVYPPNNDRRDNLDNSNEEEQDDDDVDEKGDLKDFVVSDNYEGSDAEEESDGNQRPAGDPYVEAGSGGTLLLSSTADGGLPSNQPSPKCQPSSNYSEEGKDGDDSDDSLPPIDSYFANMKRKTSPGPSNQKLPLVDLPATTRNKRNNCGPSRPAQRVKSTVGHDSDSDIDIRREKTGASSGGKRKRSAGNGIARPKKKAKMGNGRGRRTEVTLSSLKKSSLSSSLARERYFNRLRKNWESSAKIDKALELLAMIRRDFPDEKTLVFSQFTSFLDLMEIPISDDGYNYRRYDGSMSNNDRDAAVDAFVKKPEVKLMLVSLRCGNAGLNLYAATRVILLDPFWNPSVEDQAVKRAHRLGQTRPVTAYRVLVEETIEDRILGLQEKKRQLVNNVLDPEARKGVSRLSVSELAGLFGINWRGG